MDYLSWISELDVGLGKLAVLLIVLVLLCRRVVLRFRGLELLVERDHPKPAPTVLAPEVECNDVSPPREPDFWE